MPIKRDLIKTDRGINRDGGAFFCSNMRPDPTHGMVCGNRLYLWKRSESGTTHANLTTVVRFTEREYSGDTMIGALDSGGRLYFLNPIATDFYRAMSGISGNGKGMAVDIDNEFVYAGSQYVGRTATTTLDGAFSQGDTSTDISSTSGVPASGYAFVGDGEDIIGNDAETIQYTGLSGSTITGITRGKYNSTDQDHGDGDQIMFFDNDFKDFGASETYRPVYKWNDYVFIGNGNYVAGYSTSDAGNWSTNFLDLPSEETIVDFSEIPTSSGSWVVIAVNVGEKGFVYLWDGSSESWERRISVGQPIDCLSGTYIGTESAIYQTDGYILEPVFQLPDNERRVQGASSGGVAAIKNVRNFLIIAINDSNSTDRGRGGVWVMNKNTGDKYYSPPAPGGSYGLNMGDIYHNETWGTSLVASDYDAGAIHRFGTSPADRGNYYQFVYEPDTGRTHRLQDVKLNIDFADDDYYNNSDLDFDVVVRYYTFDRPFLQYAEITEASTSADEIVISDILGLPEVGDRVEIIHRTSNSWEDVANAPRNVTAVTSGASKYTLTLDDDLPATIGSTMASLAARVIINPLKKMKKISVSGSSIDHKDLNLRAPMGVEFKKLMIEVEFRLNDTGIAPRLNDVEIISEYMEY